MKKLFYLLLLGLLVGCSNDDEPVVPSGPARPPINKQDSLAIVAYYHAMKCAEWKEPFHWDITDYETWGTIVGTLDKEKNEYRVTEIYVSDPSYLPAGYSLPPELGTLSCLKSVIIWGDERAAGEIPKEIFNCPLRYLCIIGKGFSGTIPKEIGKVSETLEWLEISNTSIGGEIPDEIGSLHKLDAQLLLVDNNFSGKVPLCFRDLKVVTNLLSNNFTEMDWRYFTEDIGYVPHLPNNRLSGKIPSEVLETERWERYKHELGPQQQGYGFDNFQ